jgi:xanthine dehydrogenase accessory factor
VDLTRALLGKLTAHRAIRVLVAHAQGSVPRDAGTWMAVVEQDAELIGTIGGGRLELDAIAHARALLDGTTSDRQRRFALGPSLGQCCGGVVELRFECHDASTRDTLRHTLMVERDQHALPVALFGGGHVGQALVRALSRLPMTLHWVDSREAIFPSAQALGLNDWPEHLHAEHSLPVHAAVQDLTPGAHVLIMSFSHAEDLDVVIACLQRQRDKADLPFIGLIGSKTKWATFRHRLEARGFTAAEIAQVTCPIGLPGIEGKEPEVIAASVTAQLLGLRQPRRHAASDAR